MWQGATQYLTFCCIVHHHHILLLFQKSQDRNHRFIRKTMLFWTLWDPIFWSAGLLEVRTYRCTMMQNHICDMLHWTIPLTCPSHCTLQHTCCISSLPFYTEATSKILVPRWERQQDTSNNCSENLTSSKSFTRVCAMRILCAAFQHMFPPTNRPPSAEQFWCFTIRCCYMHLKGLAYWDT